MTPRGFTKPLYILPFDHRGSFETGMFGWKGDSVRHIHRYNNAMDWLKERLIRRFEDLPNDIYFPPGPWDEDDSVRLNRLRLSRLQDLFPSSA